MKGLSRKPAAPSGARKASGARTQGAPICRHIGTTEDAAARSLAAASGPDGLSGQALKRHPGLVPLSHDHHRGLSQARGLRRAAAAAPDERLAAARAFAGYFRGEALSHFRDEEEKLFPLVARHASPEPDLLRRVRAEHMQIQGLVRGLEAGVAAGEVGGALLTEIGKLFDAHIRIEERELFPLIERIVPDAELAALDLPPR